MKSWESFVNTKSVQEGRFDNVDLGSPSMMQRIMQARRNVADTLQELVDSKEIDPNMTVANAIAFLRG